MVERDNIRDLIRSGEAMEYSSEQFSDLIDRIQAAGFPDWLRTSFIEYCLYQNRINIKAKEEQIKNEKIEALFA